MENRHTRSGFNRLTASVTRFLPIMLVFTGLFINGCAAIGGNSAGNNAEIGVNAESSASPVAATASSTDTDDAGAVAIEPTVVAYSDYRDPLSGINRAIFAFNDVTYRYALIPLSKGYIKVVPGPVRGSVSNFFYNIKMPIYLVNNTLQFKFKSAGKNLLRFGINSTLGLFGLFDPAKAWFELDREEAHFGDTLAHYGAGYGIYLVLPLLGPSDLRSGTSVLADYSLDPVRELVDDDSDRTAIQAYDYFNEFAPEAEQYETLRQESEDPYIFFRNLHLQNIQRDAEYEEP